MLIALEVEDYDDGVNLSGTQLQSSSSSSSSSQVLFDELSVAQRQRPKRGRSSQGTILCADFVKEDFIRRLLGCSKQQGPR